MFCFLLRSLQIRVFLYLISNICLANKVEINIINFADIYNLESSTYGSGLLSLEKTLLNQRRNNKNVIICSSGDILLTNGQESLTSGAAIIKILNRFYLDFASFGNHEFAFGLKNLEKNIKHSNFAWLGSNITKQPHNLPINGSHEYIIKVIDGVKIGFFSVCLPKTKELYAKECKNLLFSNIDQISEKYIKFFKKQNTDLIVALTHQELKEDIYLSNKFSDINVIIGAHDHKNISMINNKTLILKSGSDAGFFGKIKIIYNKKNKNYMIDWHIINNEYYINK